MPLPERQPQRFAVPLAGDVGRRRRDRRRQQRPMIVVFVLVDGEVLAELVLDTKVLGDVGIGGLDGWCGFGFAGRRWFVGCGSFAGAYRRRWRRYLPASLRGWALAPSRSRSGSPSRTCGRVRGRHA